MPEDIKRVEYYSAVIANKIGEGARILNALREGGVNFTALWGYPLKGKSARLDMLPADAGLFRNAAKKAGLVLTRHAGVLAQGADQPGAMAAALSKLSAAGINVVAAQALASGSGRYSLMIEVDDAAARAALKALTAVPKAAPVKKTSAAKKSAPAKSKPAAKKK
ncbi:MAG: ACT domain-containing protein [Bryobacterales bacterium]|nr:ACT domain-containing protein [Bryobacterales bacterium]